MDLVLHLGGYVVKVHEPHGYPCLAWPLRPFESFIASPEQPPDIQVEVTVIAHLPELPHHRLRFDAGPGLWKLFDTDSGLAIESLNTLTLQPRVRACVSRDYRHVRAWILPELLGGQVGWCPMYLFNPVIEVCLLSRLARDGGLLLHAAGLSSQQHGYVFTGPSGAGKSTIAQRFADRQAFVLSDERVVLRHQHDSPMVYGTPWVGSGNYAANASAPLTALYVISHGRDHHRMDPLPPSKAMSLLLQQSFLPRWDDLCLEQTLDYLISLMARVPCHSLAFLNQADVVDAIQNHVSAMADIQV